MSQNLLQLNEDKTEVIIFGAKAQREQICVHLRPSQQEPGEKPWYHPRFWSEIWHIHCHRNIFLSLEKHCQSQSKKAISRLQLVKNAAARVLTKTRQSTHITPILKSLHWLPISLRIDFNILSLVFKSLNGLAPSYLSDMLHRYAPSRFLRSSAAGLLVVPKTSGKKIWGVSFQTPWPSSLNSLPLDLRESTSVEVFKQHIKIYLFSLTFN